MRFSLHCSFSASSDRLVVRRFNLSILAACFGVYAANKWFASYAASETLRLMLTGHLSDLLAMPALLAYTNWVLSYARGCPREITRFTHVLAASVMCGFLWEGIMPFVRPGSVADPLDVVAYVIGGISYSVIIRYIYGRNRILGRSAALEYGSSGPDGTSLL